MPLMGSLYIGNSGLQTSQNALNTTAHNMTNADTVGYVRQQVQQGTKVYNTIRVDFKGVSNQQVGLGVNYSRVKQIRDYFLDQTYRRESGRSAFYEVASDALEEVENLLDELNGESFQESLEGVWTAIQELSKDPSSAVTQGLLVQKSSQFIERAKAVYNGMCDYQDNLNQQIKGKVDTINKYADRIRALNEEILKIECAGFERANDLRDERNRMLDELSTMGKISYSEDLSGQVNVQFEGVDLVKREVVYEIGPLQDENTGFYTPFWTQNAEYTINSLGQKEYNIEGAKVFDLNTVISSDLNTDIGSLKSMLLARGDHRADYTDVKEYGRMIVRYQHGKTEPYESLKGNWNQVYRDKNHFYGSGNTFAAGTIKQIIKNGFVINHKPTYFEDRDEYDVVATTNGLTAVTIVENGGADIYPASIADLHKDDNVFVLYKAAVPSEIIIYR